MKEDFIRERTHKWALIQRIKEMRTVLEDMDTMLWNEVDQLDEMIHETK